MRHTRTPSAHVPAAAWIDARASRQATRAAKARAASTRRRKVDPTTCERDSTAAELEFMAAMQAYKLSSGRMFPTWSEVLEVLRSLGYQKPAEGVTGEPPRPGLHVLGCGLKGPRRAPR